MKTAAPVLLASDKSKRTKEMPSSTDRTTFLQMEASTLPEDNFRQIHNNTVSPRKAYY